MLSTCVGMCMCGGGWVHVCVCAREKEIEKSERTHRWRPQVSMVVFSLLTLHLSFFFFIERGYLMEPRACQLGYANWPIIWGSPCLCLHCSSTDIIDASHCTCLLPGYWGLELRSSCLHSRYITT